RTPPGRPCAQGTAGRQIDPERASRLARRHLPDRAAAAEDHHERLGVLEERDRERPVPTSGRAPGEDRTSPSCAVRRLPETELARALRPRAPTLPGADAFGDDDLLLPSSEVGSRRERAATESLPRRLQELKTSEKSIAGIDRPVPAALALREAVPHAGSEAGVPAAADHGDEGRHGRAAPGPGFDLHDALPRRGLAKSPPSGKATRSERERRRPQA